MANLHDNLKTNMAAIVNKAYWMHADFNKRHEVSPALLSNLNITRVSEYRPFTSQSVPQMLLFK